MIAYLAETPARYPVGRFVPTWEITAHSYTMTIAALGSKSAATVANLAT